MLRKIIATLILAFSVTAQAQGASALGPGDSIKVTVYNHPDLSTEAQVSDKGTINFPLIGEVDVNGLSKSQAEDRIAQALHNGNYIPNPEVNILVTEFRSQQISILGEVQKPGKYPIRGTGSLTDMLAEAGGVTEKGGDQVVLLRRQESGELKRYYIDLNGLFGGEGQATDPKLAANDIIHVPAAPVFYIYGEVRQPGAYPLEPGLTVQQALSVGGGLTVRGTERGLRINRSGSNGQVQTLKADLTSAVKPGDVVYVKESLF